jgi:hypothetical protein
MGEASHPASQGDVHRFTCVKQVLITLWLFNITMGNGPFIDGLPIKNGDFPWQTVSHNQMVITFKYCKLGFCSISGIPFLNSTGFIDLK